MQVDADLMQIFTCRADRQILGLELLAIALALCSFDIFIHGRRVRVWSDNTGAEAATRRGCAKAFDHNCIIHGLWTLVLNLHVDLQLERVPTKDNIADCPSRGDFVLLESIGAEYVKPKLRRVFYDPCAWESVS